MRLIHIESNHPALFGPLAFHDGLNVIFARVKDPAAKQRSAHNLGKSFLMDVIDFALGADFEKDHPFKKRRDLFGEFEFTIQVRTNDGRYVSARRLVQGRASNRILVSGERIEPGTYHRVTDWTHRDLSFEEYKERLTAIINLKDLYPYPFRKGLGYQLRGQNDYADEFQISKFSRGRDREWRPFVAQLLGFRLDAFLRSYDIEDRITSIKKTIKELEGTDERNRKQYDEVRGLIEIREREIADRRSELSQFHFTGVERGISEDLVSRIEARVAELNVRRYTIDRDLHDIEQSMEVGFEFDVAMVERVYRAAGVELPGLLVREFSDLIEFNRRISRDRHGRLSRLRSELLEAREKLESEIDDLDLQRQQALTTLREAEAFAKYRQLNDHVFELEAGMRTLRERLAQLGQASSLKVELAEQQKALLDANMAVATEVQSSNDFFSLVRQIFNAAVFEILGVRANLSAGLNNAGHIEFKTSVLDEVVRGRETFQGEGTSYKKLLCACVDLALLQAHADGSYYRFVYHDGVFEGLDNRRKVALLDYVRRVTARSGLQYFLTVIDSDLPRDERDNKLLFSPDEVVLSLHDSGADGRLFRMDRF